MEDVVEVEANGSLATCFDREIVRAQRAIGDIGSLDNNYV